MTEQLVSFDENNRLSGILSTSAGNNQENGHLPGVVFLNAGIIHRVGPNRLHVQLARLLSELGFASLRFDLSGLGESGPAAPGRSYEDQAVYDIKCAIDIHQEKSGCERFVLAGLCSGADNGYRHALSDPRVCGVVMLDPYAYQHPAAKLAYLAKRAQDPDKWKGLISRLTSGQQVEIPELSDEVEGSQDELDMDRIAAPREVFGSDLESLTSRGVELLLVYTRYVFNLINHPNQFFETFQENDFQQKLEVEVYTDTDHTFTKQSSQKKLQARLITWLQKFN